MATLYVQNVPDKLYEALREQAENHRKSIAAEVVALLELNVTTREELRSRREFLRHAERLRARKGSGRGPFPSTEQLQGEDRTR